MSAVVEESPASVWKSPSRFWAVLIVAMLALGFAFYPGIEKLVETWSGVEEYSYAWFVPPISLFLIWQKSDELRTQTLKGSWGGLAILGLAAILCIAGRLTLVRVLLQYGFIVGLVGLVIATIGWRGARLIAWPLFILVFMVPLPHFVLNQISEQLQLISSQIGVSLIRACDISVYLQGNIIDLGSYQLEVADACSGLRYLFPLIALGALAVYFFRAPLWQRLLVLLSTVPLTILVNSLRLGFIGFTVDRWGAHMAEGFLHQFEGWFMFMVCLGLLLLEMAVLSRLPPSRTLRDTFVFETPQSPPGARLHLPELSGATRATFGACVLLALIATLVPLRVAQVPPRASFTSFPLHLPGGWIGRPGRLDDDVVQTLELDDYVLADYVDAAGHVVNYYIAYYASQTGAEKASHSPRMCIPGGGWKFVDTSVINIPLAAGAGSVPANRVIIQRGDQRELVYYWFKQRQRLVTDDWTVKWYIIADSLAHGPTDGALIRLVAPIPPGVEVAKIDAELQSFVRLTEPLVPQFVPD